MIRVQDPGPGGGSLQFTFAHIKIGCWTGAGAETWPDALPEAGADAGTAAGAEAIRMPEPKPGPKPFSIPFWMFPRSASAATRLQSIPAHSCTALYPCAGELTPTP